MTSSVAGTPAGKSRIPGAGSLFWPVAGIVLALAGHLYLALTRAINWDEFYHYSQVQKLAQGTLTEPLQTLYTRAFVWAVDLPGFGVDHIIAIRMFMFLCIIVVAAAIFGAASRFVGRVPAAFCALIYLTAGYVLQHGTSFRFDAPAAALLMAAAWILLRFRLSIGPILAAGLLAGLSAMLTIKTILYAPVFLGIAWLLWSEAENKRRLLLQLAAVGAAALGFFALIYLAHASSLVGNSDVEAMKVVSRAGGKMFHFGYVTYWLSMVKGVQLSLVLALVILAFPVMVWKAALPKPEKLALTGFYLPILTLFFYHNTAPYFYVYMLPPVTVACGVVMASLVARYRSISVTALLLLGAGFVFYNEPPNMIERQRQILRVADRMFPGGVAYFDSCAMLGSFPKANVFMTPWGIDQYLLGGFPSLEKTMASKPVPLMVNDDYMFEDALNGKGPVPAFLPRDLAAIRDTFVHLWGPFWIAGEDIPARASGHAFKVRVPGFYTVGGASVTIGDRTLAPGQFVHLDRGDYRASTAGDKGARLIWGKDIQVPAQPDAGGPLFMPF
ncbi:hypothetical protein SKP52_14475 [Sphingopyxis fribergensis]|uniref:Uncharacterized protein n=1 Tax=Sphingopyxis fribergensis TaxID=1515612 RepID=A0A0A7PII5_9SPHN|nr:glycosyltransferase family 39 protein [Sphingopyxis fribergensis]AJA09779.1 hypothetical protein SKP52_14475 [Sphingopyxis fribergensis]